MGLLPPVGFSDPLECAKNGSKENVLRRRAVKIKHGRFSLQACIGYFVPEYSKLEGYLSPSMGIKLSKCRTVWPLSRRPRWLAGS